MRPLNRPSIKASLALVASLALSALIGCARESPGIPFYLSSRQRLFRINRLVFIELSSDPANSQIARDMTEMIFQRIQSKNIFHVEIIQRNDPICRGLPLDTRGAYDLKDLADIRDALNCDAVMFGRITGFQPYPGMRMGMYLRLWNLADAELIWGVDHVWDTTQKDTERRIRSFFAENMRSGYEPAYWRLAMTSPAAFGRFVAHEVAQAMPEPDAEGAAARSPRGPVRETLEKIRENLRN